MIEHRARNVEERHFGNKLFIIKPDVDCGCDVIALLISREVA